MTVILQDTFYHPYSFAVHFGYSSKREIQFVKNALKNHGLPINDLNIKSCLEFIRDLSPHVRTVNRKEINSITSIVKKERITGGFIPVDIQISHECLNLALEYVSTGLLAVHIADKFSGDRISKYVSKSLNKLQNSSKTRSMILLLAKRLKKSRRRKKNLRKSSKSKKTKSKK